MKKELTFVLWHGEWKRQSLLGNGTKNDDATMEHVTPRNVTNGSACGNGVFYAVGAYVSQ
jgi:hypothetical protein